MKFSIIVPIYNVEKYLPKCFDSLLNQSYEDFEIIAVNDGSPDNSQAIIDNYKKRFPQKIRAFEKENGGLSDARNFGVEKAVGEYLLFIDSDDFVSLELLQKLANVIENEPSVDLIGFNAQLVFEDNSLGEIIKKPTFSGLDGQSAINAFIDNKEYFEPACFYAYRREFFIKNAFSFAKGRLHEDFGLIPKIIMAASKVTSIDFIGYYYFQSNQSITRLITPEKLLKRAFDILFHFDTLYIAADELLQNDKVREKFNSYIANSVITRIRYLHKRYKKEYIKQLKERKVINLLLADTLKRKIKKALLKFIYFF